ncbi:MAG: hypothetical protein HF300_07285 [Ignavibacteria bacterium]|jgi:hypothetical protein|nr:hypothetical protein [Ignavibacteria bacterium]MCU7512343.1 hypothetical protein [Ignavibacteria bacterium]MCU7519567.1 hypothetical protein [Ignavibacteria bacterium]MCU7524531.1 hypothetical protein [Ignavibacteria bacterium]
MKKLIVVILILSSVICLAQYEMKSPSPQNGTPIFRNNIEFNAGVEPLRHLFLGSIGYNFSLLDNYGFYITPSIGAHFSPYMDVSLKYKFPVTKYFYITPQSSLGVYFDLFTPAPMVSLAGSLEFNLGENTYLSFTPRMFFLPHHTIGIKAGASGHEYDLDKYPPFALTIGISF